MRVARHGELQARGEEQVWTPVMNSERERERERKRKKLSCTRATINQQRKREEDLATVREKCQSQRNVLTHAKVKLKVFLSREHLSASSNINESSAIIDSS
jgi:hypothetical protein